MNRKNNTTEFSAHLSRSRMMRYLQKQLDTQEANSVELHLNHCERCSEGILQYIQSEEPQHYKAYKKQLSDTLKAKKASKKKLLTKTHTKILRAAAALVLMFIFSFFAIDTVMHKKSIKQETGKTERVPQRDTKVKIVPNIPSPQDQLSQQQSETSQSIVYNQENNASASVNKKDIPKSSSINRRKEKSPAEEASRQPTATPKEEVASQPNTKSAATAEKTRENTSPSENQQQTAATTEEQAEADAQPRPVSSTLPKIEKLDVKKAENMPASSLSIQESPVLDRTQSLLK